MQDKLVRFKRFWKYNLTLYQKISFVAIFFLVLSIPLMTLTVLNKVLYVSKAAPATPPVTPPITPPPTLDNFGQAVEVNGTSTNPEYIEIPHNDLLNPELNFTVEAWIKPSIPLITETQEVLGKIYNSSNSTYSYKIRMVILPQSNGIVSYYYSFQSQGNSPNCTSTPFLVTNMINETVVNNELTWKHIAAVFENGEMKFYENGIKRPSNPIATNTSFCNSTLPLQIGTGVWSGGFTGLYKGLIDEVRISNIARYVGSYIVPTTPFVPDENTKVLYHFDGDISDVVNGVNGTLIGGQFVESTVPTPIPTVTPTPSSPVPTILTTSLPAGKIGVSYTGTVRGKQLTQYTPLSMTISGLPSGLTMGTCTFKPSGLDTVITCPIAGTPLLSGSFTVNALLTDAVGGSVQKSLLLKIR